VHRFKSEPLEPLLKALANPVRARVLIVLSDRSASAAEIAEIIGQPIGKVRYHLRSLAQSGMIGWEEAEDRRGVREYFWAVRTQQVVEDEQYPEMTVEQIRRLNSFVLRLMFKDASAALREDAVATRTDHALVRFRPQVDERGWNELVKVYRSAIAGIEAVSERASRRLAEAGEDPIHASASMLLFELETPARPLPVRLPSQE
jgi:DNA-binding transcriptional ArsR family regulator